MTKYQFEWPFEIKTCRYCPCCNDDMEDTGNMSYCTLQEKEVHCKDIPELVGCPLVKVGKWELHDFGKGHVYEPIYIYGEKDESSNNKA